jgi:tetratricopeptide (TPR) repeat protein
MRSGDRSLAAELSAGLYLFGYWRNPEMMGWAEDLADDAAVPSSHLVRILGLAGMVAWRRAALARTKDLAGRILAMAGDDTSARYGWQLLGLAAIAEGRPADACDPFRRMANLSRSADDHYDAAHALGMLALTQTYAGDESAAFTSVGANRVEAVRSGAPSALAYNAYVLGEILAASEPDQALVHLDRALALADSVEAHFIHGIALVSATSLRVRHSDPAAAASALLDVIDQWERAGHWRQLWTTLRHAVEFFGRIGDDKSAAVLLGAIEAHDTINLYGADAERLAAVRSAVQARLGPAAEDHLAAGSALQPAEVVAFTRRELSGSARRAGGR